MTTYLGEKAVGIGTVKANMNVGKVITDEKTILGDGFTEQLAVNTLLFATSESVAASAEAVRAESDKKYIKKSGDTMTGILTIQAEEDYDPSTPPVGGLSFKSNASPVQFTNRMRQVGNGFIAIEYLLNGKQYSNLVFGDQQIYIDNTENGTGNPVSLGISGSPWDNVYTKKLNNGADISVPTLGGTLARIEDIQNATATLNAEITNVEDRVRELTKYTDGEFVDIKLDVSDLKDADQNIRTEMADLQTQVTAQIAGKQDKLTPGENITIEDGVISATGGGGELPDNVLVNNASANGALLVAGEESKMFSVAVGVDSSSKGMQSVSVGYSAICNANKSVSVGYFAQCYAANSIQLGDGQNTDANTFKVANKNGNFEMMSADGTIPLERLTKVTNQIGDISTALTAILGE